MQELCLNNMPQLPYAMEEAINRLRVNVNFLGNNIRKIMLVSAMINEGKSTVSMHLWRQMAESGIRSVLLDADLRKSVISDQYDIQIKGSKSVVKHSDRKNLFGTSHYLSGDGPLEEVIYKTQFASGDIIPNFNNIINPSLLLESDRFKDMLDQLADQYRFVFVDAPPLNLVSDGERLGHYCDGAILIVHAGVTSKRLIRNCIGQLERAGCPLLGIVLNRVEGGRPGYYNKHYGKYYYGKYYYGNEVPYYSEKK